MRVAISIILPLLFIYMDKISVVSADIMPRATPTGSPDIPSELYFTSGVAGCIYGTAGHFTYNWGGVVSSGTVCGVGWKLGRNRTISYGGTYSPNGMSKLSIYGWTRQPLIEYFIVETFGSLSPASAAVLVRKGSVTCNAQAYDIYQAWQNNKPSIDGTQTFQQYWSIRRNVVRGTVSGRVDTACHFNAWAAANLTMGPTYSYQIVGVDGSYSSGTSAITVS